MDIGKAHYRLLAMLILWSMLASAGCDGQHRIDGAKSPPAAGTDSTSGVSATPEPGSLTAWAYDCDGIYTVVHLRQDEGIDLWLRGEYLVLPHISSGSGAKYRAGQVSFWSKGRGEALLETADGTLHECREERRQSLLEDAKLRGMDFRASGNEPGWVLEMGRGLLDFRYDYATKRVLLPQPEPLENAAEGRTSYHVQSKRYDLLVVLSRGPCTDTMSGNTAETTVRIMLNGVEYKGCGQALH